MESYVNENGKSLQLNQWYDCTEEEFIERSSGKVADVRSFKDISKEATLEAKTVRSPRIDVSGIKAKAKPENHVTTMLSVEKERIWEKEKVQAAVEATAARNAIAKAAMNAEAASEHEAVVKPKTTEVECKVEQNKIIGGRGDANTEEVGGRLDAEKQRRCSEGKFVYLIDVSSFI